ncbi:hypothetical protein H0H92_008535 [Tricholoma furcatifolium]|nr:hypothetical protein H0H92_008535 [Tricholoma furcatifolium]
MLPAFPAVHDPVLILRVVSPALVLLSTLSLLFVHPPPPTTPSPITSVVVATHVPRRAFILTFLSLIAFTFFLDGLAFAIQAVVDKQWLRNTGIEFNSVVGLVAFAGMAVLGSWKDIRGAQVWSLKRVKLSVFAALALDAAISVLLGLRIRDYNDKNPHIPENPSRIPIVNMLHFTFPVLRVLLLVPLLVALLRPRTVYTPMATDEDVEVPTPTDSSFLLPAGVNPQSSGLSGLPSDSSKYGTFQAVHSNLQRSAPATRAATPAPSTGPDAKTDTKPEIALDPSWSEIWRRIQRLSPYLWPHKDRYLQLLASLCIVILAIGRVINVAMPLALGQCLWAPVMQYSDREMSQLSFDHLLNLSFAWHTRRKTGEILRVLDRGAAINHTFELILFNIIPTFIDIIIALVAFVVLFQWTLAAVIFLVMFAYVAASVILTRWRTKIRRRMNERDTVTRGIHTDCLLNYETVKYFGGEEHEGARYRDAMREYQTLEYKVIIALNFLNMVQNLIITLGLLIGSMMVASRVTKGEADAGSFVVFITYLAQLYGPLNQLGYLYRSVNQSLVDTEKLLALLNEPTEVRDLPNAPDLLVHDGEIEFDNVSFSYDGRTTALNGVSFRVPKGGSVALVGESGSGKSTILRLLYRFYDLGEGEGRILIDGQDIRNVTQKSLRQAIGVVPQDSVLFNASINYNIGYGKLGASQEEIEAAAKSAQMHDRIISFADGYETKVGERGIRLSGGEKQRVAIARTLLKNPPILLLDEATSALDTSTEKDIQKALQNLVKGRSSVSIAHRLSTIASADLILVLKDGQIVEQGSHKELLSQDGIFATMWADQVSTSDDRISMDDTSVKKEVSGYAVEEPVEQAEVEAIPAASESSEAPAADAATEVPEVIAVQQTKLIAFPTGDDTPEIEPQQEEVVSSSPLIHAPVPITPVMAPLAFPTSDEPEDEVETPAQIQSQPDTPKPDSERVSTPQAPAVSFPAHLNTPPSRTGTPDPESEPKRKRISSQNFQRLARRISTTARRQSAAILPNIPIPGLKRDSPRVSVDDNSQRREGTDSPAGSIRGDGEGKKKKEKKDKTSKTSSN